MTTEINVDTIRAAAESLSTTDRSILPIIECVPMFVFDTTRPVARLLGDDGTLNEFGLAVAAWCVLTGEGFTPKAIETAKERLVQYGIDIHANTPAEDRAPL